MNITRDEALDIFYGENPNVTHVEETFLGGGGRWVSLYQLIFSYNDLPERFFAMDFYRGKSETQEDADPFGYFSDVSIMEVRKVPQVMYVWEERGESYLPESLC